MIHSEYNSIKAAQSAGYLLKKAGGDMDYYVLTKILYLVERYSLLKWRFVMLGGSLASLDHGPIHSNVLDDARHRPCTSNYWIKHIAKPDDLNNIKLKKDTSIGELSKRELKLLDALFKEFGNYTFSQMKEYTHKLPEYTDPDNSSLPILHDDIMKKEKMTSDDIDYVYSTTLLRDSMKEFEVNC